MSFHISKTPKVLQKTDFWFVKIQVSKRTKTENIQFWDFFETNRFAAAQPWKKCVNILAYSEPCIKYRDFCTWVSRWSKWNGGVTICSHYFHDYRLITGKPSYILSLIKWILALYCMYKLKYKEPPYTFVPKILVAYSCSFQGLHQPKPCQT